MSLSPESSFSAAPPLDALSNTASSSNSTPPTTVADSASLHSDTPKHDVITVAVDPTPAPLQPDAHQDQDRDHGQDQEPVKEPQSEQENEHAQEQSTPGRVRRSRGPPPVYNLAKLAGTAGHGKRRANGDVVSNRRRRTIATATMVDQQDPADKGTGPKPERDAIDALNLQCSPKGSATPRTRRQARESPRPLRNSSRRGVPEPSSPSSRPSAVGRRGRKVAARSESRIPRELRRLEDTKEFIHVEDKPVVYTVWSNGKYVDPNEPREAPARKKTKVALNAEEADEKESSEPITNTKKQRVKKFLDKGLYAGQDAPVDIAKGLTATEKKRLAELPELIPSGRLNKTMPSPMFTGLRTLIAGRDFKLPYHVCNPLPPGQPKPDEWKKMTKNRFIGESKDVWRKSPHFHDYQSKCVCKPEDGCGESCQNRIMLYECDDSNCNVGKDRCTNRAFSSLMARRAKGGKYRVGVEVIKTPDRGYGVRSNRCFRPNQIIMEYAGEIITEEECERRMNEVYKHNECYYLMSFDQNMIIDATTGSIARFVNHSCNPNCRMIKWIVSGQPRMALFAGDKPIMTGDELTYDYNFDPFSAKNVQSCLCGEPNCRGVLGPKTRDAKPRPDVQKTVKETLKAGKRKLQDFMGGKDASGNRPKKPRITSTKGALANVGLQMAKGTATAIKKGVSTVTGNAKKAAPGAKTPAQRRAKTGAVVKKTATSRVVKSYGKAGAAKKQVSARSSTTVTPKRKGVTAQTKKTAVKKTTAKTPAPTKKTLAKTASVTKTRSPKATKRATASHMTAAEKRKQRELDAQYEITVADPD